MWIKSLSVMQGMVADTPCNVDRRRGDTKPWREREREMEMDGRGKQCGRMIYERIVECICV